MTRSTAEIYAELASGALSTSGSVPDRKPDPSRYVFVLLNPILAWLFTSKTSKDLHQIGFSIGMLCSLVWAFSFGNSKGMPNVIQNILLAIILLSLTSPVLELLVVTHLQTPRGRFLFGLLYRLQWLGVVCHPGIGATGLGGPCYFSSRRREYNWISAWLTSQSLQNFVKCCDEAGYPAPACLVYPTDWKSFKVVEDELRLQCAQVPIEIEQRRREHEEWKEYSFDPVFRMYIEGALRGIESVESGVKSWIKSLEEEAATYALPSGFKVAHPSFKWRTRYNKGKVSVSELTSEYCSGAAWVLYFPIGYSGYEAKSKALTPKAALGFLGMSSPSCFNQDLEGWSYLKTLALGGNYQSVDLRDLAVRYLEIQLQASVERARISEREWFEIAAEANEARGGNDESIADRTWFEQDLAEKTEEVLTLIQKFKNSDAAFRYCRNST